MFAERIDRLRHEILDRRIARFAIASVVAATTSAIVFAVLDVMGLSTTVCSITAFVAGAIPNFTGIDSPYEPPENPELRLATVGEDPGLLADRIIDELRERPVYASHARYKIDVVAIGKQCRTTRRGVCWTFPAEQGVGVANTICAGNTAHVTATRRHREHGRRHAGRCARRARSRAPSSGLLRNGRASSHAKTANSSGGRSDRR